MSLTRRVLLGALGVAGTLPLLHLAHGEAAHRLTILHMNDFHSRHEPVDGRALGCTPGPASPQCFGGVAHLANALREAHVAAERDGREVLVLDAGDQFQGSLFYTVHKGDAELAVMRLLGTEAMTLGNHEFDDGPTNLARFVRAAPFPVLACNVDARAEPALAGLIKPYTLFDRAGLRIGVVGVTTPQALADSQPGPNVRIADPDQPLAKAAGSCRAEGARLVIALSHLGIDEDRRLAGEVPGVAVFIGGHSHTLLSNTEPGAAGPHPLVQDGPAGRAVVVQAGCFGRYVGRLDIDLTSDGTVLAYGGDCVHVSPTLPEDPAVAATVARFAAPLDAARRRPIGNASAVLGNEGCREQECAFGDFVADAALDAVHGADVALLNAGSLRTGLPSGALTLGDVMQALPFGNTLATVQLHGRDLRDAVAYGLSRQGWGAFPIFAGMRVHWNPATRELLRVEVRTAAGSYEPLDPDRLYTVATHDYLRRGGDGYAIVRDKGLHPYDGGSGLDVVVAGAIARAAGDVRAAPDGRLVAR